MTDLLDDVAALVRPFIDDPRGLPKEDQEKKPSLSSTIMKNPVIRLLSSINPISWIMEAIEEEIGEFHVPSLAPLLQEMQQVIGKSMDHESQIISQLLDTLIEQFEMARNGKKGVLEAFMASLQGTFWTLFDTLRTMMEGLYDCMLVLIRGIGPILTEVWKIPGLTDLWEDITGTEFTLLGFATFLPAAVTNFQCLMAYEQLPVKLLPTVDFATLPVHRLYRSHQTQPNFSILTAVAAPEQFEYLAPTVHHKSIGEVALQSTKINSIKPKSLGVSNSVRVLSEAESSTETKTHESLHWLGVVFENVGRMLNATVATYESFHEYGQAKAAQQVRPAPGVQMVQLPPAPPAQQPGPQFRPINQGRNVPAQGGNAPAHRGPGGGIKCIAAVGRVCQVGGLITSGVTGETAPTMEHPFRAIPAALGILELLCVANAHLSEGTYKAGNRAAEVLGAFGSISRAWMLDSDQNGGVATANRVVHTAGPVVGLVGMGLDFSKDPRAKLAAAGCHAADGVCGLVGFGTAIAAAIDS